MAYPSIDALIMKMWGTKAVEFYFLVKNEICMEIDGKVNIIVGIS